MKSSSIFCVFIVVMIVGCSDHEPPDIAVDIPSNNSLIQGIATVHVAATDDSDIDSVRLFIDDSMVCHFSQPPYLYSWNTHVLPDSSVHFLFACAYDENGNVGRADTVIVTVCNGLFLFADDFESYIPEYQLSPIWSTLWPGVMDSTWVSQSLSHEGVKSFRSYGYPEYVRTDGVGITRSSGQDLVYEFSVMMPAQSGNGALIGFFVRISPHVGEIYNGVLFDPGDHRIYVRGIQQDTTGYTWTHNIWYTVRVVLDLVQAHMDVWMDDQQIATNIPLADTAWLDTFAISTIYGYSGSVYYDDVQIIQE